METLKAKTPAKIVLGKSDKRLKKIIGETLARISEVVGNTLGPGGHPVLIERHEFGLMPALTKDGVTVYRSLGFADAIAHLVMEIARDPAIRTADEAGDGTTTATILTEAIYRHTEAFLAANPGYSPQKVVRELSAALQKVIEPLLLDLAIPCSLDFVDDGNEEDPDWTPERKNALAVARLSASGDDELADAVLRCYDICGDTGNVTISEKAGPPGYEVEHIKGFPINRGYERDCGKYYSNFLTDSPDGVLRMENPMFVLHFGTILDPHVCVDLLRRLDTGIREGFVKSRHLVLVATRFSETTMEWIARQWQQASANGLKIYPLTIPFDSPIMNAQRHFLDDLATVTGATVFDPVTAPLSAQTGFEGVGNLYEEGDVNNPTYVPGTVASFEVSRYTSSVIGFDDEEAIASKSTEIAHVAQFTEGVIEKVYAMERAAKLSGGIARLIVVGSSAADTRERKDRADDAVCAVKGALREGAYPAGCWALIQIASAMRGTPSVGPAACAILGKALVEPFHRLLSNVGLSEEEIVTHLVTIEEGPRKPEEAAVFDASDLTVKAALASGLLDSAPAVRQALRTALSTAAQLGTIGGVVAFPRNEQFEREDAHKLNHFTRTADYDPNEDRQ